LVRFHAFIVYVNVVLSSSTGLKNKLKAELKKLQGKPQTETELVSVVNYDVCLAENNALRMVASMKEDNDLIPRPVKEASRKGFKLQVAIALEDDDELYATLHVRPIYIYPDFYSSACSVLLEMLSQGLVLTILFSGPINPRTS
jgi:hypothetical protein